MPVHVSDPLLGPAAAEVAKVLLANMVEEPDAVIMILTKNVSRPDGSTNREGRTAVGTAARYDLTDDVVDRLIRYARRAVAP